ncbi:hypothetical protein N0V93_006200 [Gnomoniopsis smithogilvyi]|uniref:Uncharacterized protein n=1 Tax=Gnomoniopsis smithogilvyi TaxID=1191159 RepID=A0A9W8YRG5_9PEZI|nr:hypothetical protein N0V93_006200 [Gnomoniopsis smithogilvyi]
MGCTKGPAGPGQQAAQSETDRRLLKAGKILAAIRDDVPFSRSSGLWPHPEIAASRVVCHLSWRGWPEHPVPH